jgi:hypothetical protein
MTFSQPKKEVNMNKDMPTKETRKMMRIIRMNRLWHPLLRTCQGVCAVGRRMVCGLQMAVTLPKYHRIFLRTVPTTPARMKPITHPQSLGSRLSPIQAPFSEVKRDLVSYDRWEVRRLLDNFPLRCYNHSRTNVLIQNQEEDGLWIYLSF